MCGPLASVVDSVSHRVNGVRKRAQDVRHMEEKRSRPSAFPTQPGEPAVHWAILMAGVPVETANPGGVMVKEARRHCLWEHLPLGPTDRPAGLPCCHV